MKTPFSRVFIFGIFVTFLVVPGTAMAAAGGETMSLTIAPAIFNLNLAPGDEFRSYVRVVNGNTYAVTLHASAERFAPSGETGNPVFDLNDKSSNATGDLASWIHLSSPVVTAAPGATVEVPFIIHVPADAEPGGHYAGILVGNAPLEKIEGSGIAVGSYLSAPILLRIAGDVKEEGAIRDFFPDPWFISVHKTSFILRFENKGNVHVIPHGEIVLYNMWGKERGKVSVNETESFGNVLPGMVRKFSFTWEGEPDVFDIGRYKAVAYLSFGEDGKKSVTSTTHFWIIPWKEILLILVIFGALVRIFLWSVKRYVRRALQIETERLSGGAEGVEKKLPAESSSVSPLVRRKPTITADVLVRPLRGTVPTTQEKKSGYRQSIQDPRFIFGLMLLSAIIGIVSIGWYFHSVLMDERVYHVEVTKD